MTGFDCTVSRADGVINRSLTSGVTERKLRKLVTSDPEASVSEDASDSAASKYSLPVSGVFRSRLRFSLRFFHRELRMRRPWIRRSLCFNRRIIRLTGPCFLRRHRWDILMLFRNFSASRNEAFAVSLVHAWSNPLELPVSHVEVFTLGEPSASDENSTSSPYKLFGCK